MSDRKSRDERMKKVPGDAGFDPETTPTDRRCFTRRQARGVAEFHRPGEEAVHAGTLTDISEGGLAFSTCVSLAVGETLFLTYQEEGEAKSAEATVTTVHSHPREDSYVVGVRFAR